MIPGTSSSPGAVPPAARRLRLPPGKALATLLIESAGALGGAGINALVPAWCPFSDKEKMIYRVLAETVFKASKARVAHVGGEALDCVPIDAERLKLVYDDFVADAGASILFHTFLASVERVGDKVSALRVARKSGLSAFSAIVYVDCTSDADLCGGAERRFSRAMIPGT